MSLLFIEKCFIWLVFYSVVGWIYESILCSVQSKKLINRGFLNGPYCPIYGSGAVFDILLLGKVDNVLLLFLLGVVLTSLLEYLTSYVMEKAFHARWWDYSDMKFNLNGRICLVGAIVFGVFSVVLIRYLHPVVSSVTDMLSDTAIHITSLSLLVIIGTDTAITIGGFSGFNKKLHEFTAVLSSAKSETADRIRSAQAYTVISSVYESLVAKLNGQQRRMLKAFPKLKSVSYNSILTEIRGFVHKVKK